MHVQAFRYVKLSAVYSFEYLLILFSLFSNLTSKLASCRFKKHTSDICRTAFISTAVTTMSSLYRDAKDGEIIGIIIENKHVSGLEINFGV